MTDLTISSVPFFRKLWVVVTLTCLLIPMPIAMIILLTGPVYRWRDGGYRPITDRSRHIYGGLLVLWLVAATAKAMLQPGGIQGEWDRSADPNRESAQVAAPKTTPSQTTAPTGKTAAHAETKTSPSASDLDIRVATEITRYGESLVVTAGETPFALLRVVFNGREEEANCDLPDYGQDANSTDISNEAAAIQSAYGTKLPQQLKTGDRAIFFSGCGEIIKFTLHTDHGTFNFNQTK